MNKPITVDRVRDALSTVIEPELHKDLITLDFIKDIRIEGADISFTIMLTTPACPLKHVLSGESEAAVRKHIPEAGAVDITFDSRVRKDARISEKLHLPIGTIVAVSSGKGGVGKSTVAANLAISLALDGARTGILDADIYGPNIPMMFGIDTLPKSGGDKIKPARMHGVEIMSMGFLISPSDALVWRGPMLHSAISQLFTEVAWSELDYLIVDLPPGTGDAQLSLAQLVPLTGGIIVTSPQAVAVGDARRGADAFRRLDVPILGVVENMSGEVFGRGGGERVASELGIPYFGSIELDPEIAKGGDSGKPIVVEHPDRPAAVALRGIARKVAAGLSVLGYARG